MPLNQETANSIATLLAAISAFIVAIGTFVMQWINNRNMRKLKEGGERRGEQIAQVHDLVKSQTTGNDNA